MTSPDELALKILMDPAAIPDPHPLYKELRETAPLFKTAIGDMWIVSGFENCRSLLRDSRVGSPDDSQGTVSRLQGTTGTPRSRERQNRTMLFLNPPDHTRIRSLVSRAFTPRRVEQLRPEITAMTDSLLDELGGEGDFVDAVAFPLPANVISALVGVPESKRDWLRGLITDLVPMIEPAASDEAIAKAEVAGAEAAVYLAELIEERRAEPQNDMLSALIQASDGEDRLTEEEVISNVFLIYAAGFETTTHLLGNMVRQLIAHPDQLARVRNDRSLIPNAVEEVLRFDPPVQLDGRYVFEDIEIDGVTLGAGDSLITFLAGANRDPAVCDDPDTFDVGRDDIQIMSFGSGIHFCLGAALARLEGQVVLERLVDRYSSWEITAEPVWQTRITIRGVERLDVKFA